MYDAQVINVDDCFVDVIDYVEGLMYSVMLNKVVGGGFGGYVCGGSRSRGSVVYGRTEYECLEKLFRKTNFIDLKHGALKTFPSECMGCSQDMFNVRAVDGGVVVEVCEALSSGREDRFVFVPSRRVISQSKLWYGYYWQSDDSLVLVLKLDTGTLESVTFKFGEGRILGNKALTESDAYDMETLRGLMFRVHK